MVSSVAGMITNGPESISRAQDTLVKAIYLKRLIRLLDREPEKILDQLEQVRAALCQVSNFRVVVIGDVEKLKEPVTSWEVLTQGRETGQPLAPLDKRMDRLSAAGLKPGKIAYVVPVPSSDSSFLLSVGKGLIEWTDPRLAALMVAIAYLDATDGPMWAATRGTGLAYGTQFERRLSSGHVCFQIYRSPDAFKAFTAGKEIVEGFISGATPFADLELEGAISSIIFDFVNGQSTMTAAAQDSFIRQVIRALPDDFNDVLLRQVRSVTTQHIKESMKDLLLPLFVPETCNLIITCGKIMEKASLRSLRAL